MIPDTTAISEDDGTITWQNENFQISLDEAKAISEKIIDIMADSNVDAVLVDNRDADGTWPTEVNEHWPELMAEMYEREINCATVSPSVTNSMQINRLSEDAGINDRIKAYKPSEYDEALDFLGIDS